MEFLTKLEENAIDQIAKDLRRCAKKATDIPWYIKDEEIADGLMAHGNRTSVRKYQRENISYVMDDIKEVLKYMEQLIGVLNNDHKPGEV